MWASVGLREIRTFLILAEELHFGRTADRLGVTASRVSQTIQTLETLVGGRLFDRTSRRVRLTPLGEQLRADMAPGYKRLHAAFLAAREAATGVAGVLRLGMYSRSNGGPLLLDIVKAYQERCPASRVQLIETGFARDQFDWLRQDDVDLLAMRLPVADDDVVVGPILSRETRVLIVARDHPLASRDTIDYDDIAPYIVSDGMLPAAMMDAFMPPVTPSGHRLRRTFVHGINEAVMRVSTGEIVHPTVRSFLDHYPHPSVVAVPIRDLPASETALVWLLGNRSAKVTAFAEVATDVMRQHVDLRDTGSSAGTGGGRETVAAARTSRRAP
jgi:DNA-binding transcriptional LysR family regulator